MHVKLETRYPCIFPFIQKNVTYNSCTKMYHGTETDHGKLCATRVNATDYEIEWVLIGHNERRR